MNKKILLGMLAFALIACGGKFLNAAMKDYASKASTSSSVKPPSSWDDGLKTLPRTDKITRTPLRNEEDVKKVFTPPSTRDSEKSTRDIQTSSRQTSEQIGGKAGRETLLTGRDRTEREALEQKAQEKIDGTREKIGREKVSPLPEARTRTEREALEQKAQEKIAGKREKIEREKISPLPEARTRTEREALEQKVDKKSIDKRKVVAVGAIGAVGLVGLAGVAGIAGAAALSGDDKQAPIAPEKPAGEDIGLLEQGSGVGQSFGAETFEAVN